MAKSWCTGVKILSQTEEFLVFFDEFLVVFSLFCLLNWRFFEIAFNKYAVKGLNADRCAGAPGWTIDCP